MEYNLILSSEILDVRDGTHDSPKYLEKGYPLITSKNLKGGKVSFEDVNYISKEDFDSINKRSKVDKGDILYSMIGTIGNFSLVDDEPKFAIKNVALFKFNNDSLYNRYFYYLLNSSFITNQIVNQQKGGTQKFVTLSILRNLRIPLPDLATQQKIAAFLDKADELRRYNKQLIEKYDALTQSLFLDMFGDPVRNEKGWQVKPLGEILDFLTSGSRGWAKYYSDKGDVFLRIQNVGYNYLKIKDLQYINTPKTIEAKRTKVQEGDIIISITADLGRTAVIPNNFPNAYINQHLSILRLRNNYNPVFVSAYIASSGGQKLFKKMDKGGVKAGLNFTDLKSYLIACPSIQLQNQFAERIRLIEQQKELAQQAFQKSEELFNSLLQKAFKGELILEGLLTAHSV